MSDLTPEERQRQENYRDARVTGRYNDIWQSVGKCVFCDLNPDYVFFEENGVVMTVQLYAYIDGHIMIIPRRHITSVKELTPLEWETMRKCMYLAKKAIRKVHGIKGIQIVQKEGYVAQSTVEHLHFHCIPFDAPDLSVWNYRKLKFTPHQSAEKYRAISKTTERLSERFNEKYQHDGQ
jgi:diadenosine tetraphosphate (Ap4A) HIT family hydrolase